MGKSRIEKLKKNLVQKGKIFVRLFFFRIYKYRVRGEALAKFSRKCVELHWESNEPN